MQYFLKFENNCRKVDQIPFACYGQADMTFPN
jgi:hypothetical protein